MFLPSWKDCKICDDGFGIEKIGDGDTNAIRFWLLLCLLRTGGFTFDIFFWVQWLTLEQQTCFPCHLTVHNVRWISSPPSSILRNPELQAEIIWNMNSYTVLNDPSGFHGKACHLLLLILWEILDFPQASHVFLISFSLIHLVLYSPSALYKPCGKAWRFWTQVFQLNWRYTIDLGT